MNDKPACTSTLREGYWTYQTSDSCDPREALRKAGDLGEHVQGIAYTTAGAVPVFGITADGREMKSRIDGKDCVIPLDTVYEFRLWSTGNQKTNPDGRLAHEVRWLNGWGESDVTVWARMPDEPEKDAPRCWVRENDYLQHDSADDPQKTQTMHSIEVFVEEPDFSNTIFVDELMNGAWGPDGE